MRYRLALFSIFIALAVVIPSVSFAQTPATDILENTSQDLTPQSMGELKKQEEDNLVGWICKLLGSPLICAGYQTHTIYSPNAKIPQDVTEDQVEQVTALLDELESGEVAGTSSGQVLQASDNFFTRFLSDLGLFINKETAVTTRHTWPNSIEESLGTDAEAAVESRVAHGILMPAAMQEIAQGNPDENPSTTPRQPQTTPDPNSTPGTPNDPNAPVVTGDYTVYYQNDPVYASIPLPDQSACSGVGTYINAACGGFTAVNALVNNGITRLLTGETITPKSFIDRHYSNMSCDGSGIEQGRQVLSRYGFETGYIIQSEFPYLQESSVINELQNQTAAGWMVWVVADYLSASGSWIGHHVIVVKVAGGKVYTLDPYYGFGKSIPYDQSEKTLRYKSAFKFRKV